MARAYPIKILVKHDDPIAYVGLCAALSAYPEFVVVDLTSLSGEYETLTRAIVSRFADVLVADYEHGTEFASRASHHSSYKVVIVASIVREYEIRSALERGVHSFVVLGCALEELATAIRSAYSGARYLSPQVAQRLAESMSGGTLTRREHEVLKLLASGLGNKQISRDLDIAVGTVKSHLKGIFDKLNVESRTQAISAAERRGLLSSDSGGTTLTSQLQGAPGMSKTTRDNI